MSAPRLPAVEAVFIFFFTAPIRFPNRRANGSSVREVKQQINEAARLLPSRTEVYIFRAWCLIIRTNLTWRHCGVHPVTLISG